MQYKGLGRINNFNYIIFKNTFLILIFLFSIFGCSGGFNANNHLAAFDDDSTGSASSSSVDDDNTGSASSSSVDDENISDSVNSALHDSVKLSWVAPSTNADGSRLTDLGGYIVYYGEETSTDYTYAEDVGNLTYIEITDLTPGTWCFALASYDIDGNESDYSFEVCKDI
jgi:hypothetical protein